MQEIERKFLIKDDSWKSKIIGSEKITQGYLSDSSALNTIRVRIIEHQVTEAVLTIKGQTTGIARTEIETSIDVKQAIELMKMCGDRVLEKKRNYVYIGEGKKWEIDEFLSGKRKGLVLAEIELNSEDEEFEIPSWVGEEVSTDPQYFNYNMV